MSKSAEEVEVKDCFGIAEHTLNVQLLPPKACAIILDLSKNSILFFLHIYFLV